MRAICRRIAIRASLSPFKDASNGVMSSMKGYSPLSLSFEPWDAAFAASVPATAAVEESVQVHEY